MPKGVENNRKGNHGESETSVPYSVMPKGVENKGKGIMANPKLRPLDDRVVVEPLEAEEKTPGGLLLPDTAKQKPQRGKVVAVGPGKLSDKGERIQLAVAVDDEVIYGRYAGNDVTVGGKELKIMRESDILAKVTK
jgi:chaperonin GroES